MKKCLIVLIGVGLLTGIRAYGQSNQSGRTGQSDQQRNARAGIRSLTALWK